ncbi:M23 family metallopeptidase [Candidatus Woesearchaeota archaeon]|nr:M23 family metallopeptidase [Candidatus Woesearchaeota archaeon]
MKKMLLVLLLVVLISGCSEDVQIRLDEQVAVMPIEEKIIAKNGPPTIYSLGIDMDDVKLNDFHWTDKIFHEYGDSYTQGGMSPHPEFYLPVGSKVYAVSNGTVDSVPKLYSDDYSVLVDNNEWTINYEHVLNPQVGAGDVVKVGDVIGEVSPLTAPDDSFGKWGLMIFRSGASHADILSVCPYGLLDDSVKEEEFDKIRKIVSEYEAFMDDESIHDEDRWVVPGCYFYNFTEKEAMEGKND